MEIMTKKMRKTMGMMTKMVMMEVLVLAVETTMTRRKELVTVRKMEKAMLARQKERMMKTKKRMKGMMTKTPLLKRKRISLLRRARRRPKLMTMKLRWKKNRKRKRRTQKRRLNKQKRRRR